MTSAIDYASPQPWYRRRYFRRALIMLPLLIASTLAYCYGPAIYHRIEILDWQRRCMNHIDAPAINTNKLADPPADLAKLWSEFPALMHAPPPSNMENFKHPVFLHRLTSPAGDRLVYVYQDYISTCWVDITGLTTQVVRPATLFSDPAKLNTQSFLDKELTKQICRGQSTIHPGQPDPADPAAFTIDIDTAGTLHTARFRLNSAGDKLELISVTPPLP